MQVIICPGIHTTAFTQEFCESLAWWDGNGSTNNSLSKKLLIFPVEDYPAYSAFHILQFLDRHINAEHRYTTPVVFISFSAGVVGAIGAATAWQLLGGKVKAFIAIDGWGVPLYGTFPIYRLSHDYFTHWSSAIMGSGTDSFYADPAVEHLQMWRSPITVQGWWVRTVNGSQQRSFTTAAIFLQQLLQRYG